MPELPEVETVARLIRPSLEGRRIRGAKVSWLRTLGGLSRPAFQKAVDGATIRSVRRRGKHIVMDLERRGAGRSSKPSEAGALVGHLRMTGRMMVESRGADPGPWTRVSLDLDDGRTFHFIDVRKFGRLTWCADPEALFEGLGPEPLESGFTAEWLRRNLGRRKRALKPLLLDQAFLAGLGNIYVDESLHQSRLHPLRRSDKVDRGASARLHAAIRATLEAAIEREGSSFDTFYRTPEGRAGSYQHQFLVYGRTGKPCRSCGTPIVRLVVGQRGTHLCPRCQPTPRGAARAGARP